MPAVPTGNSSRAKWADHLDAYDIDYPDNATRADLIDLWNLSQPLDEDTVDTTREASREDDDAEVVEQVANNFKPGPNPKLADHPVPAELQFTTRGSSDRDPGTVRIQVNGHQAYLYEPTLPTMLLVSATISSPTTSFPERMRVLVDFVLMSLDSMTEQEVRAAIFGRATDFDLAIIGDLAAVIFDEWGDGIDADTSLEDPRTQEQPMNRQQRRQAARKK